MKSLLVLVTILTGLLLVACRAAPAPQPEAPAEPEITAEQPTQTPTLRPADTPVPEATDTPSPTDTPIPTDTPVPTMPPEPTVAEAPEPSPTPEPEPAPPSPPETVEAPILLAPPDGETFASVDTDVVFLWSEPARPLAEDEYFVLVITHSEGNDYTWTKGTSVSLVDGKQWLIDLGPELKWQVVIARQRSGEANETPAGAEVSAYSLTGVCYWHK